MAISVLERVGELTVDRPLSAFDEAIQQGIAQMRIREGLGSCCVEGLTKEESFQQQHPKLYLEVVMDAARQIHTARHGS